VGNRFQTGILGIYESSLWELEQAITQALCSNTLYILATYFTLTQYTYTMVF